MPASTGSESLQAARDAVREAIAFDEELDEIATSGGATKGKVFQSLLEDLRSAGCAHAQLDNSAKLSEGSSMSCARDLGLSLLQWASLTQKADALRNLVRIKVADDNDLKTANAGLMICKSFFDDLTRLASMRGVPEAEVLQQV